MHPVTPSSPPKERVAGGTNQPLGGFPMYTSPYDTRNQRTASVADEVISNIAEYAVMLGCSFVMAEAFAKNHYMQLMCSIHSSKAAA